MRIAIKFAYDGKDFFGYARQPNLRTVEGELINVLIKHGLIKDTKKSYFRSASRTDKGVSATCNVISFTTDSFDMKHLRELSDEFSDIILYGFTQVDTDFNPRYAKHRRYTYYLHLLKDVDVEKIISASNIFTGEHDFSNFARVENHKNPIRQIDNIIFSITNDFLVIEFYAQTFLWQQIRRIVFALEKIGTGKLDEKQVKNALDNPDINVNFGMAPAKPLILSEIVYDFDFEYDKYLFNKTKKLERKIVSSLL